MTSEWVEPAEPDPDLLLDLQRHDRAELERRLGEVDDLREARAATARQAALDHEARMGRRMQMLREERGWSQADLAERLAEVGWPVHQTTVAKLEAGRRPLRVAEVYALSLIFRIPAASFFYLSTETESPGMAYMQERQQEVDRQLAETRENLLRFTQTFAEQYAELAAQQLAIAAAIRQASLTVETETTSGEHPKEG